MSLHLLLRYEPFCMLSAQSDLLTRIESWTQEVERHTRQCKKAFALAETGRMGRGTNPRSLAPREALDEITSNSRPRKRRAPSTMPDSKDAAANTGKKKIKLPDVIEAPTGRGRGRPRKEQPAPSNDESMPLRQRPSSSHPILPPPTKPSSAPRSRSASPRKTSIDMSYLLECNPKVRRRTYKQIYQDGDGEMIPDSVRLLYQRLTKVAKNVFPHTRYWTIFLRKIWNAPICHPYTKHLQHETSYNDVGSITQRETFLLCQNRVKR